MVIFAVCANLHTEIKGQLGVPEMWNWNKVELRDMNDADVIWLLSPIKKSIMDNNTIYHYALQKRYLMSSL